MQNNKWALERSMRSEPLRLLLKYNDNLSLKEKVLRKDNTNSWILQNDGDTN